MSTFLLLKESLSPVFSNGIVLSHGLLWFFVKKVEFYSQPSY